MIDLDDLEEVRRAAELAAMRGGTVELNGYDLLCLLDEVRARTDETDEKMAHFEETTGRSLEKGRESLEALAEFEDNWGDLSEIPAQLERLKKLDDVSEEYTEVRPHRSVKRLFGNVDEPSGLLIVDSDQLRKVLARARDMEDALGAFVAVTSEPLPKSKPAPKKGAAPKRARTK